ncbi:hypothetical protein [Tenacibaculum sp. C7A-26P2]|uniref:hypothetical protein n=1 Tax=Tenacibaculum sp. C7A-26P2 TaxID=3447504 RepID=UPI003F85FB2A
MTKEEFLILINRTSFVSFKFAERYLKNKLVPEFRYDVHLNSSNDNPKLTQFDIYPEDNDRIENGLTDKEVRDLIYRNGKVPVWIDVAVHKSDRRITTFKLPVTISILAFFLSFSFDFEDIVITLFPFSINTSLIFAP